MVDIAVTLIAFAVAILVVWLFPSWARLREKLAALETRTEGAQKIGARLGLRQARLTTELADVASERARLELQRDSLAADIRIAEGMSESLLRILDDGPVGPNATIWQFMISNRKEDALAVRGGGGYFFDGSWTRPQSVLVPAPNLERARTIAEQRFPAALGFTIVKCDVAPPHLARMLRTQDSDSAAA